MTTHLGLFLLVSLVGPWFSVHFASSLLPSCLGQQLGWYIACNELPHTWLVRDGGAVGIWVTWNCRRQGKPRVLKWGCWREHARMAHGYIPAVQMLQGETLAWHSHANSIPIARIWFESCSQLFLVWLLSHSPAWFKESSEHVSVWVVQDTWEKVPNQLQLVGLTQSGCLCLLQLRKKWRSKLTLALSRILWLH